MALLHSSLAVDLPENPAAAGMGSQEVRQTDTLYPLGDPAIETVWHQGEVAARGQ